MRKVSVVFAIRSEKRVDRHMGEHDVDVSPSPSCTLPSLQECVCHDASTSSLNSYPFEDVKEPKEKKSLVMVALQFLRTTLVLPNGF